MKTTNYNFWGKWYLYFSILFFLLTMFLIIFFSLKEVKTIDTQGRVILFLFLFSATIFSVIDAWIHPLVKIEDDGVLISRLYFFKRKIKWSNLILKKKIRTFTRPDFIGIDPRYALIIIKDGTIIDKYVVILPFFKDYDGFISEIERNLNKADIFIDKNYR